jgi:hypothetical protein
MQMEIKPVDAIEETEEPLLPRGVDPADMHNFSS